MNGRRLLLGAAGTVAALLAGCLLVVVGVLLWAKSMTETRYASIVQVHSVDFPVPFPLDETEAAGLDSADPQEVALDRAIARGRHLVESRLGCNDCHGADYGGNAVVDSAMVGRLACPNLTSGKGSVTAGFTVTDWDHIVRHGVLHTGKTSLMPAEDFANLSDRDLSDVIAFLRTVPPVDREMGASHTGPILWMVLATGQTDFAAYRIDHDAPHTKLPPAEAVSAEFGRHIAQSCTGCHGPNYAGGPIAGGDPSWPPAANLTSDESGLKTWKKEDFFKSLREGKRPDGSAISDAMPWKAYGKMNDTEIEALWTYLQTLPPTTKGAR